MIKKIFCDGIQETEFIASLKIRSAKTDESVTATVTQIIEDVRLNGDTAVRKYTEKFDGKAPESFEIDMSIADSLTEQCDKAFLKALLNAAANIEDFHKRQVSQSWLNTKPDGVILGQRVRGLKRVGIYVPGGTAAYPSSVLMAAIPAKLAGVEEIIMVTPPQKDGFPDRNVLAAAKLSGVDRVFTMGGAQAIAALALGTETVPKVDKIVGPGNIFVATAKKLLFGTVDIDMIAGPSEILIIADDSADSRFIAADLMGQAEHDVLASSLLVTTSEKFADDVIKELEIQSKQLSRSKIIEKALADFGAALICKTIDEAVSLANSLAPEHLEVCLENPMEYIGRIDNAGSVFLGNYSPEALGDYYAGPNHVLPTSGTARFFSPLSVESFTKKTSFIYYTQDAFNADSTDIITLAQAEGLTAHANSVKVRL